QQCCTRAAVFLAAAPRGARLMMFRSPEQRRAAFARMRIGLRHATNASIATMVGLGAIAKGGRMGARLGRYAGVKVARASRPHFRRLGRYAGRQGLQSLLEGGSTPRMAYAFTVGGIAESGRALRHLPRATKVAGGLAGLEVSRRGLRTLMHYEARHRRR